MPMSTKNLDILELNVEKLKTLVFDLRKENLSISHDLEKKENQISIYKKELNEYKIKYESLIIAESLQGNNDKTFTKAKLKIIKNMQKIKLTIANRIYPLNVPTEQEEGLRAASKKIEIMIKHYEENYAVKDKQDVLAMCALQLATQNEQENMFEKKNSNLVEKRIETLNHSISEIFDK